jgi:hypothetical protein
MVRPRNEALDPHGNIYRALEIACAHLQHNSTNTPERVPENTGGVKSTAGCVDPEAEGFPGFRRQKAARHHMLLKS